MPLSTTPIPYRIPSALRDLVLVDMLELTGSTVAAARHLNMSQSSVSRRYRRIATELGLERSNADRPGRRYGNADWMRLLRQGVNHHRLACGVLRLGGPAAAEALVSRWGWSEWIRLPSTSLAHAEEFLQDELLDGVVLDAEQCGRLINSELVPLAVTQAEADSGSLWLYCRVDPLVQATVQRLVLSSGATRGTGP